MFRSFGSHKSQKLKKERERTEHSLKEWERTERSKRERMRCPTLVLIGFVASCAWLLVSHSLGSMHYWDCSLLGLLPYGLDAFNGFVASCG